MAHLDQLDQYERYRCPFRNKKKYSSTWDEKVDKK